MITRSNKTKFAAPKVVADNDDDYYNDDNDSDMESVCNAFTTKANVKENYKDVVIVNLNLRNPEVTLGQTNRFWAEQINGMVDQTQDNCYDEDWTIDALRVKFKSDDPNDLFFKKKVFGVDWRRL